MGKGGSSTTINHIIENMPRNAHNPYMSLDIDPDGQEERPRVLIILSALLDKIVACNEKSLASAIGGHNANKLTVFHGLRAPTITIDKYLDRIFKYANCSPACFVVAYIYIDRILAKHGDLHVTSLNVHRLLVTSVMLAAKFLDDAYFNNAYYAKVGGVTTSEMNRLELEFLFRIDFRLNVTTDVFFNYCKFLEGELWRISRFSSTAKTFGQYGASPPEVCHEQSTLTEESSPMETESEDTAIRTPPRETEYYSIPVTSSRSSSITP